MGWLFLGLAQAVAIASHFRQRRAFYTASTPFRSWQRGCVFEPS